MERSGTCTVGLSRHPAADLTRLRIESNPGEDRHVGARSTLDRFGPPRRGSYFVWDEPTYLAGLLARMTALARPPV